MKKPFLLLIPLFLLGTTDKPALSLEHAINVPDLHIGGGLLYPDLEKNRFRYIESFERAFWTCVKEYTEDIDYKFENSHAISNGWNSTITGYRDGYVLAHEKIQKLIKYHGKESVHTHLKSYWIDPTEIKVEQDGVEPPR